MTIGADEEADVWIYTRSTTGADFSIVDEYKKELVPSTHAKHPSGVDDVNDAPSRFHLTVTGKIRGPKTIKVKAKSGSMFSYTEKFLVVTYVGKV